MGLIFFQNIAISNLIGLNNHKKKYSDALVNYYKCITQREIKLDLTKDQYKYDFFMSRCSHKHPDVIFSSSEAEKKAKVTKLMMMRRSKMQQKLVDYESAKNLNNRPYTSIQSYANNKSYRNSNYKIKPQNSKANYILHFIKEQPTDNKFCRIKKSLL